MLAPDARREVVEAARAVAAARLVVAGAGNISVRDGDHIAITPRGGRLAELVPADCTVVDLAGTHLEGDRRASSELPLHLAVYADTDAAAIVHTHSVFATAVAAVATELPAVHYACADLGGPLRVAPYATFGSDELAAHVAAALHGRSAALMANHGVVAIGATATEAVERATLTEWLAEVYVHARAAGTPTVLGEDELRAVAEQAARLPAAAPTASSGLPAR
jgi:L-fuculose-phosphate aldolase